MATNKKLNAVITIGGAVASSLKSAFGFTNSEIDKIGKSINGLKDRQRDLNRVIQEQERLGRDGSALKAQYAAKEMEQIGAQINALKKKNELLQQQERRIKSLKEASTKLGAVGAVMTGAGAIVGAPFLKSLGVAEKYQTEMARINSLGLGAKVSRDAELFARGLKTIGTSKLENLELVKDTLSVFGDLHDAKMAAPVLAKMKFGNAALYGAEQGAENERKFMDMLKVIELRGGTNSEAAFKTQANLVQQVLTATGGRVGPEEWRHLIATGGIAAKGMRDDAFYQQLEPLVQEMGGDRVGTGLMTAYYSLYQGHMSKRALQNLDKFGLIADKSKVTFDKAGQVGFLNPGALKGAEMFRQSQYEWMKQVLLPTLAAKGVTTKDQVLDAIGSIFSSRKGADLLAAMFLQSQNIDKRVKLNKEAYNIDQLEQQGKQTTAGKKIIADKNWENFNLTIGTTVLPIFTRGIEAAGAALEKLNAFMERHSTLAKVMAVSLGAVAATLAIGGPLLIGLAALPMALVGLEKMKTIIQGISMAFRLNPIGLAITAIAAGAYLIYENWKPIKEFFTDLFNTVGRAWDATKSFFGLGETAPAQAVSGRSALPNVTRAMGRNGYTDNSQTTINVTQLPGQDAKQLAEHITRIQEQQRAARYRGRLADGMGAQ